MSIDHETPFETIPVIDCDVHRTLFPTSDSMRDFLPKRWRDYIETYGLRGMWITGERPYQRRFAARTDAWGPEGQYPGTDPDFVRAQHLDAYDYSGALVPSQITDIKAAMKVAADLGYVWTGNAHNLVGWAELLVRVRSDLPGCAYPNPAFGAGVIARTTRVYALWRETLRYHKNVAAVRELETVRAGVAWLMTNRNRL